MSGIIQQRVDLHDNKQRQIDNPLAWVENLDSLDRDARLFAERVNRQNPDYDLFVKAARVARDPVDLSEESVPGITRLEQETLAGEKCKGFWQQPKPLQIAIANLCLGEHHPRQPINKELTNSSKVQSFKGGARPEVCHSFSTVTISPMTNIFRQRSQSKLA
jgi:hypothetical protein